MSDFRPRKLTIWVVFDVESESEVQNAEFRATGAKNCKNRPSRKFFFNTFIGFLKVLIRLLKTRLKVLLKLLKD